MMVVGNWKERVEMQMAAQWKRFPQLAAKLSEIDPEYNYHLPTPAQWSFACMNGYEQSCPGRGASNSNPSAASKRPNVFGIVDFLDYDLECSNVPALFMGQYDDWNNGQEIPDCRCHQVTQRSTGADDSIDELIVGRFVIVPDTSAAALK